MPNHLPASSPWPPRIQVLIADDSPHVRQSLRQLFEMNEALRVVGEAMDGLDAVSKADALHPDVILMDLEMPRLDGCVATRQIKASQPTCRIIALTIYADEKTRQRASQAGVDDFIEKGAPINTILRSICQGVDGL
jgi:two-component system NarL family response regulator